MATFDARLHENLDSSRDYRFAYLASQKFSTNHLSEARHQRYSFPMELDKAVNGAQSDQSPIRFRLNASSGVPTYVQLINQVEQALRIGYLNVGDRLPRIKEVVESLAINPNTVLKAYKELETKGIASGRPGVGTFIVASPPALSAEAFDKLRQEFIDGWLKSALKVGLDHADIITLVQSALETLDHSSSTLTSQVSQ